MICTSCNKNTVHPDRIELLDSTICIECANNGVAQPSVIKGVMEYNHKTAGSLQILTESAFTIHKKAFGRIGQQSILRKVSPSNS